MADTVSLPMILPGFWMATRGRRAAAWCRACTDRLTPGAMMPPSKPPSAPTTSKVVTRAAKSLLRKPPKWGKRHTDYYYWLLGSQSLHQHGGTYAVKWRTSLEAALLKNQRTDGSFAGSFDPISVWGEDGGRVCTTALAVLSLQSTYRYAR